MTVEMKKKMIFIVIGGGVVEAAQTCVDAGIHDVQGIVAHKSLYEGTGEECYVYVEYTPATWGRVVTKYEKDQDILDTIRRQRYLAWLDGRDDYHETPVQYRKARRGRFLFIRKPEDITRNL